MKKIFLLAFCLFLGSAAMRVKADSVTLTGIGNSTFEGVSAGPYTGTLNGSPLNILCLSFDRVQSIGETWQVAINSLTPGGVANALYGSRPDALALYQRAAFLYDQMSLNPAQTGDIHGAVWNIFNPGITPDTAGSNFWLSFAAAQNLSNYDFSRFLILTPVAGGGQQEFLVVVAPVPEPATILLLGTGIAGLSGWARRRRKARDAADNADETPA